jgi:hypothetical protein
MLTCDKKQLGGVVSMTDISEVSEYASKKDGSKIKFMNLKEYVAKVESGEIEPNKMHSKSIRKQERKNKTGEH